MVTETRRGEAELAIGLFREIPATGYWPDGKREKWLFAASAIADWLVTVTAPKPTRQPRDSYGFDEWWWS